MTTDETLVTAQMIEAKGVWGPETVSFHVSASDIRKWAIAAYWPETPPRLFWDEEFAKETRWGGIVAPEDFNPFAWPIRAAPPPAAGAQPGQTMKKGDNILNGGQVDTFFARIRVGDTITSQSRLSHWEERTGRLGLTLYAYYESEWRNQQGELVKRRMATLIRY